MGSMKPTYFFKDKPIFGLDIGFNNVKIMQVETHNKRSIISGYGLTTFDAGVIKDGVIVDHEKIAATINELFDKKLVGDITTRRVVASIPAAKTFTRAMQLPKLKTKDIAQAVSLEAEQYIPVPTDELYMDHTVISSNEKETEILAVAVPKKIVDSYKTLLNLLGLEGVGFESTISASSRLFVHSEQSDVPTVLIDFGTVSSDITIYDNGLIVTGTVPGGGESFTELIAKALDLSHSEANTIKIKYGIGMSKKQKEISTAVMPLLDRLTKEVRRMIRYYEDRNTTKRKINQVVTLGGGANMPGLSEFMTSTLRLPVRMCDPWHRLDFAGLQLPSGTEKSIYTTVAGLALVKPGDLFV